MQTLQIFSSTGHETHRVCHEWHLAVTGSHADRATAVVCVDEPSYLPGEVRPGPAVTPEDPPLAPATGTGLGEAAVSAAAVSSSDIFMARLCREGQGRVSGMRPEERQHMLSDE